MNTPNLSAEAILQEQATFMSKVYAWMCLALAITGLIAIWTASTPAVVETIFSNNILFYGLLIGELLLVGYLSRTIEKLNAQTAIAIFMAYAALNGLTFSVIFLLFTSESISSTFFITAGTFGAMSAYGYYTKRDLTSLGNIAMMALIGLIIATVVNLFFFSEILYWITSYAGVIIFVALTAYDTQKIKNMNIIGNEGTDEDKKEAIMGALTLYLDFINLFLFLLRIFGNRD